MLAGSVSINAAPPGFLEGHLKIISRKGVELADETPSKMTAENYADYPLVILSQDGKKKLPKSRLTGMEIIELCCRRGITFWMCSGANAGMSAQSRNHSQSFRIRLSASIWISRRTIREGRLLQLVRPLPGHSLS